MSFFNNSKAWGCMPVMAMSIAAWTTCSFAADEPMTVDQQVKVVIDKCQMIVAAANSLATTTGSYENSVTTAGVKHMVYNDGLDMPWGVTVVFGIPTPTSFNFTIPATPANLCPLIRTKLLSDSHIKIDENCQSGVTDIVVVYTQ